MQEIQSQDCELNNDVFKMDDDVIINCFEVIQEACQNILYKPTLDSFQVIEENISPMIELNDGTLLTLFYVYYVLLSPMERFALTNFKKFMLEQNTRNWEAANYLKKNETPETEEEAILYDFVYTVYSLYNKNFKHVQEYQGKDYSYLIEAMRFGTYSKINNFQIMMMCMYLGLFKEEISIGQYGIDNLEVFLLNYLLEFSNVNGGEERRYVMLSEDENNVIADSETLDLI